LTYTSTVEQLRHYTLDFMKNKRLFYCATLHLVVMDQNQTKYRAALLQIFQYRDFRVLGLNSIFSSFGGMGETVAIGWIVLELTDSPFMVGVVMALKMGPHLFLRIVAGAVVDMVDRRTFMPFISALTALPNIIIALLLMADLLELWHLLLLILLSGCLNPFSATTRQSFAYDIVGPALAMQGLAGLTMLSRVGGMIGAGLVGVAIGRSGLGVAFMIIGIAQLLSGGVMLLAKSAGQAAPTERESIIDNLKGFVKEIRTNKALSQLVLLVGAVEMLGFSHMTLLPSLARDVLKVGPEGLGVMNSIKGAGALLGLAVFASVGDVRRKGLLFLLVLHVFGIAIVFLGLSKTLILTVMILIVVSTMTALSDVLSQGLMQLNVPNKLRGRAMGSWLFAIGTSPLGYLEIGALASFASVGIALMVNGLGVVILAAGVTLVSSRIRKL